MAQWLSGLGCNIRAVAQIGSLENMRVMLLAQPLRLCYTMRGLCQPRLLTAFEFGRLPKQQPAVELLLYKPGVVYF